MADPSAPTTAAPAAPGFKLKLKLGSVGGGSAGNGVAASTGSTVTITSSSTNTIADGGSGGLGNGGQMARQPPFGQPGYQGGHIYPTSDLSPAPEDASDDMDEDELDEFQPEDIGDDGMYTTRKKAKKKVSTTPAPLDSDSSFLMNNPSAPSPNKKKAPIALSISGVGRAWRKGLKGYNRPEGQADLTPPPGSKRRRPNYAEDGMGEDEGGDEFLPMMVAPGAIATSDKWQNGLPGGNEQSRQTAAMASAVNKAFPVGQPPRTGSGFLVAQPLDKNTPHPRSWKKAKREIMGPSGIPFFVTVYLGDEESPYASHMIEHPRPPPVEKKPVLPSLTASNVDTGSPGPEIASDDMPALATADVKPKKAPRKKQATTTKKAKVAQPLLETAVPENIQAAPVVMSEPQQAGTPGRMTTGHVVLGPGHPPD